jgi:uncharacterized surface protein with fasciclin (FAS1) repeats
MKKIILSLFVLCALFIGQAKAQGSLLKQAGKQLAIQALLTQLQSNPKLSKFATLFQAAQATGLLGNLTTPHTLLAPTNSAIDAALTKDQFQNMLKPDGKSMLVNFVKNHLIGSALGSGLLGGSNTTAPTNLLGKALNIVNSAGGGLNIGGANVTDSDIKASEGSIIHGIDKVLTGN